MEAKSRPRTNRGEVDGEEDGGEDGGASGEKKVRGQDQLRLKELVTKDAIFSLFLYFSFSTLSLWFRRQTEQYEEMEERR